MQPISRSLRSGSFAAAAAFAMLVTTAPAALAGGEDAVVTIDAYECTSIDVSSTKDISNVVLEFADGDRQRFEGLGEEQTGAFAGTGDHSGEVITTAWIKSGDNKSGDGPGYGERKDLDGSTCDTGDTDTADGDTDSDTGNTETDNAAGDTGSTDTGSAGSDADDDTDTDADDDTDTDGSDVTDNDDGTGTGTDDTGSSETDTGAGAEADEQAPTGTDTDAGQDDSTEGEAQPTDTRVLGVVLDRDLDDSSAAPAADGVLGADQERGLNAAAATQIRGADTLANAGADTLTALLAALAALALGAGLLRRGRRAAGA